LARNENWVQVAEVSHPSSSGRFIVLEPSKVGPQHITLIEAYLRALQAVDLPAMGLELVYAADPSSHAALAEDVRAGLAYEAVSVINAEDRRWIAKGLREVKVVEDAISQLGARDILLVTCLTAPALLIVEAMARRIGHKRVIVVLHSELEALFDASLRSPKSWGFWAYRWSRLRRSGSPLRVAVLAEFIRDALAETGNPAIARSEVELLTFPVAAVDAVQVADGAHRLAFIGYKTRMKGFDSFERLARASTTPNLRFEVIGAGKVENVVSGEVQPFNSGGFLGEVGQSTLAIFPYTQGYSASLSAAVLDALSTGVHIVATRRNCFEAIYREFGTDTVTLYDTESELAALIADQGFLEHCRTGAARRRSQLAGSSFGTAATQADFRRILADWGAHPGDVAQAAAA
jgi:hypothetical protein